jgi:hypothetical protein
MKPNPESLNDVKSLAGKIDKHAMGEKMEKSKPKIDQKKINKHQNLVEPSQGIE